MIRPVLFDEIFPPHPHAEMLGAVGVSSIATLRELPHVLERLKAT